MTTAISIVVADLEERPSASTRVVDALVREISPGDEVLWVGPARTGFDIPGFRVVAAPPGASRGALYGCGLRATRRSLVAFTDSVTELGEGWRVAAVGALSGGASVVGGPVRPGSASSRRSKAGFLVEYGPHAVPPYINAQGDVSANNVAYRQAVLDGLVADGGPVWKTALDGALAARGLVPVLVPAMDVTSLKRYDWRDITRARAHHGRLYGAQRSRGWPRRRRITTALACAVLPALAFARLTVRVAGDAELRRDLLATTPLVLTALVAWSVGEAAGYVSGKEGPHVVR